MFSRYYFQQEKSVAQVHENCIALLSLHAPISTMKIPVRGATPGLTYLLRTPAKAEEIANLQEFYSGIGLLNIQAR